MSRVQGMHWSKEDDSMPAMSAGLQEVQLDDEGVRGVIGVWNKGVDKLEEGEGGSCLPRMHPHARRYRDPWRVRTMEQRRETTKRRKRRG